jgi:hypothetical protein
VENVITGITNVQLCVEWQKAEDICAIQSIKVKGTSSLETGREYKFNHRFIRGTHLKIYLAMKPGTLSSANVSLNDGLYSE